MSYRLKIRNLLENQEDPSMELMVVGLHADKEVKRLNEELEAKNELINALVSHRNEAKNNSVGSLVMFNNQGKLNRLICELTKAEESK